jgi:hypothetical protein
MCWDDPVLLTAGTNQIFGLMAIAMLLIGFLGGIKLNISTYLMIIFWLFFIFIGIVTPIRWFIQKKKHNGYGKMDERMRYNFKTKEVKIDD